MDSITCLLKLFVRFICLQSDERKRKRDDDYCDDRNDASRCRGEKKSTVQSSVEVENLNERSTSHTMYVHFRK